jgi:hypothetical protein
MITKDIVRMRLLNQQLSLHTSKSPQELLLTMAAMQAQEYAMALWAIGLRLQGYGRSRVEDDFNAGKILRTHLLRPTWHFVAPQDIRWMLELTAPQVNAINAYMYRKTELDAALFRRCHAVLEKALEGKRYLTRNALSEELAKKKIRAEGVRLSCIMMQAELARLICSGPREGRQFTYALLEERVKPAKKLSREEALHELTRRYFSSRGPATAADYATWSGFSLKQAKEGMALLGKELVNKSLEGQVYFFIPQESKAGKLRSFLMPDYDEYGMSYKDRSAIFDAEKMHRLGREGSLVFNRMLVIDGVIEGSWQKQEKNGKALAELFPFGKLSPAQQKKLKKAAKEFEDFMAK